MHQKLIRSMLAAQVLSALTVSLCLLIDNIIIGRFLGTNAIAAYGFANPVLLLIGALGSLLAAGVQIACSKSLGKGSQEETNAGFSSAIAVTLACSGFFMLAVLLFRDPLSSALGASPRNGELHDMTRDYLAGFVIGAPASMGALILVPFLQMAGESTLLILAVLGMTVSDVVFDLLSVQVFHGGMFGIGLASSLSYYIALGIAAFYFLSRRSVFRFSRHGVSWRKIRELFRSGVPTLFTMASSVGMIYAMNQLLNGLGSTAAVAAFTVITAIGNAANCISTGVGGVSLTLSGVYFHEEDRHALQTVLRHLCRYGVLLGLTVGALLAAFAPLLASVFIKEASAERDMAILGLRLFAAGLIPCCLNNALKNLYQATGRVLLTEIISVLEGAVFPVLAAFALSKLWGLTGAWFYFPAGELITLLAIGLYVYAVRKCAPWQKGAAMLLKPDFGVKDDQLLEMSLSRAGDVPEAVAKTEAFCLSHGLGRKETNRIVLCVEEMATNVMEHGFSLDQKPHQLQIRLLKKDQSWVLRFRDDCTAFDPVHFIPEDPQSAPGLRIMMAMSREARYTRSMNLNNLMIRF